MLRFEAAPIEYLISEARSSNGQRVLLFFDTGGELEIGKIDLARKHGQKGGPGDGCVRAVVGIWLDAQLSSGRVWGFFIDEDTFKDVERLGLAGVKVTRDDISGPHQDPHQ